MAVSSHESEEGCGGGRDDDEASSVDATAKAPVGAGFLVRRWTSSRKWRASVLMTSGTVRGSGSSRPGWWRRPGAAAALSGDGGVERRGVRWQRSWGGGGG